MQTSSATATRSPRGGGGSSSQTAARLLIALDVLGDPIEGTVDFPSAVRVVQSLTRVEKLDFWMRNPDYLADELMNEVEAGAVSRNQVETHIARLLEGNAPALHRYPMARYLYGAYERIDDALAILKTYGHIGTKRVADTGQMARRDYFLLTKGRDALESMRAAVPALAWYDSQAEAIGLLADAGVGATAKRRQYEQPEYKAAAIGSDIPAITERVYTRAVANGFISSREGDA